MSKPADDLRALIARGERLRKSLDSKEFWAWRSLVKGTLVEMFTRSAPQVLEFETLYGARPQGGDRPPRMGSEEEEKQYATRLLDKDLGWLNTLVARMESGHIRAVSQQARGLAEFLRDIRDWILKR